MKKIKKLPLLTKSSVISVTGSPVTYIASFFILVLNGNIPPEQQIAMITGLYIVLNIGRVFALEYMYERWPKYTPLELIKRLFKK